MDRLLNLIKGEKQVPSALERALKQYSNETISKIIVCRAPVQKGIQTVLNITTGGELDRKLKEFDYEDLYHLSMFLVLKTGLKFKIEKNERINFVINPPEEKVQCETVSSTVNIPFGQFIQRAINRVGISDFVTYDAQNLNCQNFVMNLLKSNGISNPTLEKFILQDANALIFDKYPQLSKIMKGLTDVAGKIGDIKDAYDEVSQNPLVKTGMAIAEPFVSDLVSSTLKKNSTLSSLVDIGKKGFNLFKKFTSPVAQPDPIPEPQPQPTQPDSEPEPVPT